MKLVTTTIACAGWLGCLAAWSAPARGAAGDADAKPAAPKRLATSAKAPKRNPVLSPIEDTPGLPRVLLIGDSISMGYTLPVRALLKGKANVHRPATNCGPTTVGLANLDKWLGKGKWDVIHFNWGLHDLKYMDAKGLLDPSGTQQVPPDQYAKNLRELVQRLQATGAKLIWCSTTPVPQGAAGRKPPDAPKYNQIAAAIMKEEGVATDDLYAFALPRLKEIQQPKNVHFTSKGSQALAEQVAAAILKALGQEPKPATRPADE